MVMLSFSCSRHVKNISTPSKKEIRKAMEYSDWRYINSSIYKKP